MPKAWVAWGLPDTAEHMGFRDHRVQWSAGRIIEIDDVGHGQSIRAVAGKFLQRYICGVQLQQIGVGVLGILTKEAEPGCLAGSFTIPDFLDIALISCLQVCPPLLLGRPWRLRFGFLGDGP